MSTIPSSDFIARISKPSTESVVFGWLVRGLGVGATSQVAFMYSDSFGAGLLVFVAGLAGVLAIEVMLMSFSGLGDVPQAVVDEAVEYPWTEPARAILADYFHDNPQAMLDWNTLRHAARRELRSLGKVSATKSGRDTALVQANARLRASVGTRAKDQKDERWAK